jgi:cytochrome c
MSRLSFSFALGLASAGALALAACTPKVSAPPEQVSSAITNATPLPAVAAPAPAAPGAPAAAAPAATAGVGAPGPGMIKLDVKFNGGDVYGNPTAGAQVFAICSACHSIQPGTNLVGPSLHGIVGRHSGIIPGYNYSAANKGSGIVWTEQNLYTYLENPQKMIPGTYMTYTGVKDPQQRADVVAYLQQNTK